MLVRLMSDLHLEFSKYKISSLPEDSSTTLILAGDIGVGKTHRYFVEQACTNFQNVILILGNHEYFNNEVNTLIKEWREIAKGISNLHFLQDDSVIIGDVKFIGSTMWTDMKDNDWFFKQSAKHHMADYSRIRFDEYYDVPRVGKNTHAKNPCRRLVPDDTVDMHNNTIDFFDKELANDFDGKTVIVTHHLPIFQCISPKYHSSTLNNAYHAQCDWLINKYKIDYWFHGHTHDSVDFPAGDTRIICNPRGYIPFEPNTTFDPTAQFQL